jgi:hypothetical protein
MHNSTQKCRPAKGRSKRVNIQIFIGVIRIRIRMLGSSNVGGKGVKG